MPPLQNVGVVTTFYTLVGILSILFWGVALDIITCRPPSPTGEGSACVTLIAWSKNDNLVVVLNSALRSTAFVDTNAISNWK